MIVSLKIPDELYASYAERNPKSPQGEMEKALKAFKDLDPGAFRVILEGENLKKLNNTFQHPCNSPEELLEQLARNGRVSLPEEGVEIQLNEGQRARLKAQAAFFERPYPEFVKQQVAAGVVTVVGP